MTEEERRLVFDSLRWLIGRELSRAMSEMQMRPGDQRIALGAALVQKLMRAAGKGE